MFYIKVSIIIFLACISCTATDSSTTNCPGRTIKDVPETALDTTYLKVKHKIEYLAGLENLEDGSKHREIRVWFNNLPNKQSLIVLKKQNDRWTGSLNRLEMLYGGKKNTLYSITRTIEDVTPKSGWHRFSDSLIELGIVKLPGMHQIPNYPILATGSYFTVEFADCNMYRFYSYQNPWSNSKIFTEASKVVRIIDFIESEFGFKTDIRL